MKNYLRMTKKTVAICLSASMLMSVCSLGSWTLGAEEGAVIDVNDNSLRIGSSVSSEDHKFDVSDVYYSTKMSETNGNHTTTYGGEGHYLIVKLNFTNLATEAMESHFSSRVDKIKMTYADKYEYEGEFVVLSDDIVPLDTRNAYLMFSVPETMESDNSQSIAVAFCIDGIDYSLIVQEGNAETAKSEDHASKAVGDVNPEIRIGDIRTDDTNFLFVFDDLYYTNRLSEKNGNVTYSYGSEGNYLVIKLKMTNLKSEALENRSTRVSDVKLKYSGKYDYEGDFIILQDDIVPLATGNGYLWYAVPELLSETTEDLVATFKVDGKKFSVNCRNYEYVTYSDSETVKKVQEKLNSEGFECGTPDGMAGPATYAALNAYQEKNGLAVMNAITDDVLVAMGIN